ncbi:hypothetical protein RFI_37616 [Reticulomyxa filosa]|uniref:Uncharacterized protein n=1 Tax=Reticulomyxa filosa TaxID=46433 RepID=X6LFF6_RETFI|nr:hypothetical protein RFI_37616 [Reticulomyxa filosa]|eukprot:ETN99851.1 hypothetical protein RFI_37616 [Reticulomyxa filosa]
MSQPSKKPTTPLRGGDISYPATTRQSSNAIISSNSGTLHSPAGGRSQVNMRITDDNGEAFKGHVRYKKPQKMFHSNEFKTRFIVLDPNGRLFRIYRDSQEYEKTPNAQPQKAKRAYSNSSLFEEFVRSVYFETDLNFRCAALQLINAALGYMPEIDERSPLTTPTKKIQEFKEKSQLLQELQLMQEGGFPSFELMKKWLSLAEDEVEHEEVRLSKQEMETLRSQLDESKRELIKLQTQMNWMKLKHATKTQLMSLQIDILKKRHMVNININTNISITNPMIILLFYVYIIFFFLKEIRHNCRANQASAINAGRQIR